MNEPRLPLGKECTKCGDWKLLDEFPRYKLVRDGRAARCKECTRAYQKAYRHGPRREEILEQNRKTAKARRAANIEERRRYAREYAQRPEARAKRLAYNKQRYKESPEKYNEATRLYRQANPEKVAAKNKRYRENNRELHSFWVSQYHHRKRANGGDGFTYEEWIKLCEQYGNVCLCCGSDGPLEMDHVIPISRGGKHELANLAPLCRSCNAKKSAKTVDYRPQE